MITAGRRGVGAGRLAAAVLSLALLASCAGNDDGDATGTEAAAGADATGRASYTITAGDTLSGIAARAGVSLADILAVNGWPDGSDHPIFPGDVIVLPDGASTPAVASTTVPVPSATGASAPPTTVPPSDSTSPDADAALACDGAAIRPAIGDPDLQTFDAISCADGWAGVGYLDAENSYTPAILKAEGGRWVLQDWSTVCDLNPDMPAAARIYCPGG